MFPANQPAVTPPTRTAKEIFDSPALDKLVGYTGAVNGTTYKYTVGRSDQTITAMGAEMTANIGLLAAGFRTTLNELGKKAECDEDVRMGFYEVAGNLKIYDH